MSLWNLQTPERYASNLLSVQHFHVTDMSLLNNVMSFLCPSENVDCVFLAKTVFYNRTCFALAALYPQGKDIQYPLDRRLGGPQSWSGHRGYRKYPLPLPRIKP
jgi:hypothetical protein